MEGEREREREIERITIAYRFNDFIIMWKGRDACSFSWW